ncbi:MAG: sugar ABC transporter permease [Candidatus Sumerlaeaceae bacterium]|nr:sugar ABC transporter permease [Candidatus Sumerlaeaceae bacterium]
MAQYSRVWEQVKRNRNAYIFIAPFYVMFLLFMLFPILFSLYLSFLQWNGIMAPRFVGLENYVNALTDENFHGAVVNTFVFTVLTVTFATLVGLGLAIFLNSVRFMKRFYRGVFFIPSVVSLVVVSLLWKLMLNSEVGLVNEVIHSMGQTIGHYTGHIPEWTQRKFQFIDHPNQWVPLLTITGVNLWAVVGFNTVIYLAGLQSIPANLYEVSRLDGATPLQNLRYITIPLLRPTTFFVILITTIDALQVFVQPQVMNRDNESTMTIVYYLFRNAFEFYKMGYASAIAYMLFALTVGISLVIRHTLGRRTRLAAVE